MILVDTSVWIDHLRRGDDALAELLINRQVLSHPFVIGELACGNLRNRLEFLTLLRFLPRATIATDEEVLLMIERHRLMGRGVGYIDAHLLTSTILRESDRLWTRDQRLHQAADTLGIAYASG